jgi:hypothetical protein
MRFRSDDSLENFEKHWIIEVWFDDIARVAC